MLKRFSMSREKRMIGGEVTVEPSPPTSPLTVGERQWHKHTRSLLFTIGSLQNSQPASGRALAALFLPFYLF